MLVSSISPYKNTHHVTLGPPLMTSFNLNYLQTQPHSKAQGIRTSKYEFVGTQFSPEHQNLVQNTNILDTEISLSKNRKIKIMTAN